MLRQAKPMAKYMGYGAKGLGCLLVQNTREVYSLKQANPMAAVQMVSGTLNETTLSCGFKAMFSWNWERRKKMQGPNSFLARFPNKAKMVELKNQEFQPHGTNASGFR